MLKSELIKEFNKIEEDFVVIIGDFNTSWCNIEKVKVTGCAISLIEDFTRPFSDDN